MMPQNALSSTIESAAFLPPRATVTRLSPTQGQSDAHYGGVAIGNPSLGIVYQIWTAYVDLAGNIWLEAPNTPAYIILPGVNAVWVALAFDQNARLFIAYSTLTGAASYYWYDSTIPGYRTSAITGVVATVFAALDDVRPAEASSADIIFAYVRAGNLYYRQQRDRFGVEYNLGAAPAAALVQIGMNAVNRFQFEFKSGNASGGALPPLEWTDPP